MPMAARASPASAMIGPATAQKELLDMVLPPMAPTPCSVNMTPASATSTPRPTSRPLIMTASSQRPRPLESSDPGAVSCPGPLLRTVPTPAPQDSSATGLQRHRTSAPQGVPPLAAPAPCAAAYLNVVTVGTAQRPERFSAGRQ